MRSGPSPSFVRDLDILYQAGSLAGLSDRELLGHFTSPADAVAQRAFEAIVGRHGPMVLATCRRALHDEHRAEDAFQATFLVLAMRAGAIRDRDALGPWLHGVAARISRRARIVAQRRREASLVPERPASNAPGMNETDAVELRSVVDEEVERLPARYRRAIVLCYLEGKTQDEAARELGWTKGTVSGRLARAKELLRSRLTRRGFAPSAGLPGGLVLADPGAAAVPTPLADGAVKTALSVLLGQAEAIPASGRVIALARGVLRTILLGKIKLAVAMILVFAGLAVALAQSAAGPGTQGTNSHAGTRKSAQSRPAASIPGPLAPGPPGAKLPDHARLRLGAMRLRHQGFVSNVAFSPDGKVIASAGRDGVRFWDAATGEPAAKFRSLPDRGDARGLAFSPDGTALVTGYADGRVGLRDLATVKERFRQKVHTGTVEGVAFAPDGQTFATVGLSDSAIRIWDAAPGQERRILWFREEPTYRRLLAFSPDSRRLALGVMSRTSDGEAICIWDLNRSDDPVIIRKAHDGWLLGLTFTPAGTLISCGQTYKEVRDPAAKTVSPDLVPQICIWDATSGRKIQELEPGAADGKCQVALSRDGRTLVSAHRDRILVWDLASARITRSIDAGIDNSMGMAGGLAISPDGTMVAAERQDHAIHLWDIATGKPLFAEDNAHASTIVASISADGRLAATGDDEGIIRIWDSVGGATLHRLELGGRGRVWSLRFAPDGRALVAAGEEFDPRGDFRGIVRLWSIPGFAVRVHFRPDHRAVCAAFSPDGRRVAVGTWNSGDRQRPAAKVGRGTHDNGIDLLDAATGERLMGLPGHKGRVRALAFALDGSILVSAGEDATMRCWDLVAGRQIREIPLEGHRRGAGHPQPGTPTSVEAITISPDGKSVVTSGLFDDRLLVRDLRDGRVLRTFPVETYSDGALAISPDGRLLAAAMSAIGGDARDTAIRIWAIPTKREIMRLEPGVAIVRSLAFSGDGRTLISGMSDTTALVWDVSTAYDALKRPPE